MNGSKPRLSLENITGIINRVLVILILLTGVSAGAQEITVETVREKPVFPATRRETREEGVSVTTDTAALLVTPEVRALSDSLIEISQQDALVAPGAPSVVLRRHVESPHEAGVYVPKAPVKVDTTNYDWWYLLKHKRLNLEDPRVRWPRLIGWGVGIYNKINRAINSYDPEYIGPTGKSGKVRLISDNWSDQYFIKLDPKTKIDMLSEPFYTLGINVSYLGIGYTYSLDLSNIIGNRPATHTQHKFGFGTQMFQLDYKYNSSKGGSRIRRFSKVPSDVKVNHFFPGTDIKTWSVTGYYFFNNKKYSQGAAYSFSKLQKKSAGTFLAGLSYARADLYFDFEQLPEDLRPYLEQETKQYRFHYRNMSLLAGYAYNLVLHRRLLLNITVLPGIGFNKCFEDSQEHKISMVAGTLHGGTSLAYNLDFLFFGFDAKWDMLLYKTSRYSLTSSILNFSLSVGRRF